MVDLGPPAQRVRVRRRADRRDHELLHVDVAVGVGAAVEDVHHRDGQQVRRRTADVPEQRQADRLRPRPGRRRARRRGSRWRRSGTCPASRPGRSAPGRRGAARSPRSRPARARSRRGRRSPPAARPDRRSARRRRAARPPRTGRWRRRSGRPPDPACRRRGRPRPPRWDCRASRGSRGRRRPRWWPRALLRFVRWAGANRSESSRRQRPGRGPEPICGRRSCLWMAVCGRRAADA